MGTAKRGDRSIVADDIRVGLDFKCTQRGDTST